MVSINADSLVATGNELIGHNMFAYCWNNAASYYDPSGDIPADLGSKALLLEGGCGFVDITEEDQKRCAAIKKYNSNTVAFFVDEIGTDPNKLNVTFYPDEGLIHIENSYLISDKYEKLAVISAIMNCDYYDSAVYGNSVETMLMEWSGHNFVYHASTSSRLMHWFFQWRGYEDPIGSTMGVDFRKELAPSSRRNYEWVTLWGWLQW